MLVAIKLLAFFGYSIAHNSSSVTFKAVASILAVDTRQSPRLSISSIVLIGTPLSLDNAGIDKLLLILIFFSCINTNLYNLDY